jgi:acyl carrier protein
MSAVVADFVSSTMLENKLIEFMKMVLRLGDDVTIDPTTNLIDQVGLDSIEAFNAVATMHEIMDQPVPDDFNPKVVATVRALADFLVKKYPEEALLKLVNADMKAIGEQWDMAE